MHLKVVILSVVAVCLLSEVTANTSRICYSCKGINCLRTSVSATKQCTDPLDYCVTIFDKFSVVQKGCSYEVAENLRKRCDANTAECHKCNTDRCNNLGQAEFKCIECDSSKDSKCASAPAELEPTRCGSPTAPNSYCYVQYDNNVTKRGCLTTVVAQQSCYTNANCLLCMAGDISGCNRVDFTPGTRANQI